MLTAVQPGDFAPEGQAMYKANPGMTAQYYGSWHDKMRAFDTLARQLGPQNAFLRAFGNSAMYGTQAIPGRLRKEADEAIASAVSSQQPA